MLRVAGSLVTNQVRAYDLLRMFGRDGHPTPLGQAFVEYGRIAKTTAIRRMRSVWNPKQSPAVIFGSGQPNEPSRFLSVVAVKMLPAWPSTVTGA